MPMKLYTYRCRTALAMSAGGSEWKLLFAHPPREGEAVAGPCLLDPWFHRDCAKATNFGTVELWGDNLYVKDRLVAVVMSCCRTKRFFSLVDVAVAEPEKPDPITPSSKNTARYVLEGSLDDSTHEAYYSFYCSDVPAQALVGAIVHVTDWAACPSCRKPDYISFTVDRTIDVLESRASLPDALDVVMSCCGGNLRFVRDGLFEQTPNPCAPKQRDDSMAKQFAKNYGGSDLHAWGKDSKKLEVPNPNGQLSDFFPETLHPLKAEDFDVFKKKSDLALQLERENLEERVARERGRLGGDRQEEDPYEPLNKLLRERARSSMEKMKPPVVEFGLRGETLVRCAGWPMVGYVADLPAKLHAPICLNTVVANVVHVRPDGIVVEVPCCRPRGNLWLSFQRSVAHDTPVNCRPPITYPPVPSPVRVDRNRQLQKTITFAKLYGASDEAVQNAIDRQEQLESTPIGYAPGETPLAKLAQIHRDHHADCQCRWVKDAEQKVPEQQKVTEQRLRFEPVAQRTVEGLQPSQAFEIPDVEGKLQYVVALPLPEGATWSEEKVDAIRREFERRLGYGRVVVLLVPDGHEIRVTKLVPTSE